MIKALRLWLAKRRLTNAYLKYSAIRNDYSCGDALLSVISDRYVRAKARLNGTIDRVNQLDPNIHLPQV